MTREHWDHKHPELPKNIHPEIPEHKERLEESRWWAGGYTAPTIVVLFTIFWCLAIYWMIGHRTRDWQFGTVPYVPAESVFTTTEPSGKNPPKQVILPQRVPGGANARP